MKLVISIVLLIVTTATMLSAQESKVDCTEYIKIEEDRVTGTTSAGSKEILMVIDETDPDKIFGIDIWSNSSVKANVLSIQIRGGSSCINRGDRINVLFRDGTRLEERNLDEFNCVPKFTLYFGGVFGRKNILKQFGEKEVEIMRIQTGSKSVEIEFSEAHSTTLMNVARCMIDNSNK